MGDNIGEVPYNDSDRTSDEVEVRLGKARQGKARRAEQSMTEQPPAPASVEGEYRKLTHISRVSDCNQSMYSETYAEDCSSVDANDRRTSRTV